MIFDDIKNIKNYPQIEGRVADFVLSLTENQECGKVFLSEDGLLFANVEEYQTKTHDFCRLEAHRKYIDIQILLEGVEELDYTDVEGLAVSETYDTARDIEFFAKPDRVLNKVVLKEGKFAYIPPTEAHQPQMAYKNEPFKVKKVVVKCPRKTRDASV